MPKITFIEANSIEHVHDGTAGTTVMELAVNNGVPGIDADCGGACACATCHVFVDTAWLEKTGSAGEMEEAMLEFAVSPTKLSRLSCQIKITEEMDGLILHIPESQH